MKRDLERLEREKFDVVVVGGGIFGACAAWDASQRGLSVALVERDDFGGASSANSLKMVHGGVRYLQHLDFFRIRQSSQERRAFLRMAPHMVKPLPIVVPTFGHLQKGKAFLRTGMALYDLITADRNRQIQDQDRKVPWTRGMSRDEVLELFPALEAEALTGAAVFCDGQMYNPPRLVWSVVRSAIDEGAAVANHLEAVELLRDESSVVGIAARDTLTGERLEVRGRFVLNAAGPFAETLLARALGLSVERKGSFSRDACFLVDRLFDSPCALAIPGSTSDPDARFSRGTRHLFLCPWRQYTLVGVWHKVYDGDPDGFQVTDQELEVFLSEVLAAYPALDLSLGDVTMVNSGLVPFGDNPEGAVNLRYGHRSRLIDHRESHGLKNLLTLIGVRFTTGRYEAAHAVDQVMARLGKKTIRCRTAESRVHGGDVTSVEALRKEARASTASGVSSASRECLAHNYGSEYRRVLERCVEHPQLAQPIDSSLVIGAEIVHAVEQEMATTLSDAVFRRTDLGTGECPSLQALEGCADLMAARLGWSPARRQEEIERASQHPAFWDRGASRPPVDSYRPELEG